MTNRITTRLDAFLVSLRLPTNPKLGEVARVIALVHNYLDPACRALAGERAARVGARAKRAGKPKRGRPR